MDLVPLAFEDAPSVGHPAISLTAINDNFDCKNTLWQSISLCLCYMIIILMIENDWVFAIRNAVLI